MAKSWRPASVHLVGREKHYRPIRRKPPKWKRDMRRRQVKKRRRLPTVNGYRNLPTIDELDRMITESAPSRGSCPNPACKERRINLALKLFDLVYGRSE